MSDETKEKITTSIYGINVVTLYLVAAENAVDENDRYGGYRAL
jgi:hypothetical protein